MMRTLLRPFGTSGTSLAPRGWTRRGPFVRVLFGLVAAASLVGGPGVLRAEGPRRAMTEYEVGSTQDQLALDATPLPDGMGAVFVPSQSRPALEPHVRVFLGDQVIARGPTGRRLVVPAGSYRVVVGQGPVGWRAAQNVVVRSGDTTVADRFFGALRVTAVDPLGLPVAVSYVLVSADGLRVYGPAETSDSADYAATRTWALLPGSYRIVPGTDPAGRVGSVATVVAADHRAHVRLLVDATGTAIGSEPGDREPTVVDSAWRVRWVVGGSGALGQAHTQLNGLSGNSARFDVFTDLGVTFDQDGHLLRLGLAIEQSWLGFTRGFGEDLPFQKLDDQLRASAEYVFRIARIVGPYARFTLQAALLPKTVVADGDYDVVTTAADGSTSARTLAAGDTLRLMAAFAPLTLQEGGGVSLTMWDSRAVGAGLRAGMAARQTFYHGEGRYVRQSKAGQGGAPGSVALVALDDVRDWGPEAGAWLRFRLGSWVSFRAEAEAFVPIEAAMDDALPFRVVFLATGSVSLRLADWAALVYSATLHRDDPAIAPLQFRHFLNLRFQYAIF